MTLYDWCIYNNNNNIIKEYTGIDIHGNTNSIELITSQSNKKLLWICSKNKTHKWYTTVQKRTLCGSGCPFCANQAVDESNSLYHWCIENNKHNLIDSFVGLDENNNKISIHNIAPMSHKKVKWKHITKSGEMHEWVARVADVSRGSRCPICHSKNKVIPNKNDLYTWCKNNDLGSSIMQAWTGIRADNRKSIDIHNIAKSSHIKMIWKCTCGKTWEQSVLKVTYGNIFMCKDCRKIRKIEKQKSTIVNNSITFANFCINNNQLLLDQFTGEDINGNIINANEITYGSQLIVKWRHTTRKEIHEWYASIHNRVCNESKCPICSNSSTSLPEQLIYRALKQIYPNTISRGRYQGYEFDITIPELKTCIEYGSTYYHKGREQRDKEKEDLCKKHNVRLIKVIDDSKNELKHCINNDTIIMRVTKNNYKDMLQNVFDILNIQFNIDYDRIYNDTISFMYNN